MVGSLDVLQELIEAIRSAEKKVSSRRMMDLFFKLVGGRLLLPLSQRHQKEAVHGGLLSDEDRYLPRDVRRDVRRIAQSGGAVFQVAEELFREKIAFLESEKAVQHRMRDRLIEEGATKRTQMNARMDRRRRYRRLGA